MNKIQGCYRQGEVLFIPIPILDESFLNKLQERKSNIIREGELTGHRHEVVGNGILFNNPHGLSPTLEDGSLLTMDIYLKVKKEVGIKHPEHEMLYLPVQDYAVVFQREYDELPNRTVMD